MKTILPILVLALGCGRMDIGKSSGGTLGAVRVLNAVPVDPSELTRLTAICGAIAQKTSTIAALVNTSYVFNYSQKECGNVTVPAQDGNVLLLQSGGGYSFKTGSGLDFIFTDVETTNSGSMSKICSSLSGLQNPLAMGNGNYVWISTNSTQNCNPGSNQGCVQLDVGVPTTTTNSYKIISTEWIKFNLAAAPTRQGFFTERRIITNVSCSNNQFSDKTAVLK